MPNYGGGLAYRRTAMQSADPQIAAQRIEQSIIAGNILKAWKDERKDQLRKYREAVNHARRTTDGINEFLVNKGSFTSLQRAKIEAEYEGRIGVANEMMKGLVEDYKQRMMKAGLTTSTGYNFFDLRGPAFLIYPVNVPFRNMLPRWGKVNAGYGTAINWKYGNAPGTAYAGAAEGKRVAQATPPETNAIATYKELGIERAVTFTAEFAGEGYTDNVADEHLRGLHELWLQEESMMLFANAGTGTGNNGFLLGTANTPSGTAVTGSVFTTGHYISAYVVELTALGNPNNAQYGYQTAPTVTSGLTPNFTRTNADGSQDVINGGMGAISAASATVQVSGGNLTVQFQVAAKAGAVAWAWFIDDESSNTSVAANAKLYKITTVPNYTPTAADKAAAGTQVANFTGSGTDHSGQALDFDGIFAWGASAGVWINLSDLTLTNPATGNTNNGKLSAGLAGITGAPAVQELDYDLLQQWNGFQAVAQHIWASADAKRYITAALFKNSSATPAYRFEITRDEQNNIIGGFTVSAYQSIYSMKDTGAEAIPISIHPMLPPGTILYDRETNPYPHSRIPGVRGMFVQREYYGYEWPVVTRQWTFGEYVHETFGDYLPGIRTIRTGIVGVN